MMNDVVPGLVPVIAGIQETGADVPVDLPGDVGSQALLDYNSPEGKG
jgi:hypothetical protein